MTEFAFPAVLNDGGSVSVVTAFNPDSDNPVYTADSNHPNFREIIAGLEDGDPDVWDLFDVVKGLSVKFQTVTDRVTFDGDTIYWDGDPVHSVLADQLVRSLENGTIGADAVALAKFWEKLEANPNEHSRTQAYDWLAAHKFQITPDGDVVGYKGVYEDVAEDGSKTYRSWHASTVEGKPAAYVNDVPLPERVQVTHAIGDVVTMPRSEVSHNPREACMRGLHVATRSYAASYGNVILEVHVNPRDIVSVPTDAHGDKVRVCRFKAHRIAVAPEQMGEAPVLREDSNVWAGDVGYRV